MFAVCDRCVRSEAGLLVGAYPILSLSIPDDVPFDAKTQVHHSSLATPFSRCQASDFKHKVYILESNNFASTINHKSIGTSSQKPFADNGVFFN
jgi:hypothetical protein